MDSEEQKVKFQELKNKIVENGLQKLEAMQEAYEQGLYLVAAGSKKKCKSHHSNEIVKLAHQVQSVLVLS